jgi:hypothetical protein
MKTLSKRHKRRFTCAEEVCKAMRKYFSARAVDVGEKEYALRVALDWLALWCGPITPKKVKYAEPILRKGAYSK